MLNIGSNRECFFDDTLIDTGNTTAEFRVHHPVRRECVLEHDAPWEGDGCNFHNLFYDDGIWRMYYLGWGMVAREWGLGSRDGIRICYAESRDGIHWEKPSLGICEYNDSKDNNIIFDSESFGAAIDNFMVFRDDNPVCRPEEKYKAAALVKRDGKRWLGAFCSPDGIHFKEAGIITDKGVFDTLNVVFWDSGRQKYFAYVRNFHKNTETTPPTLPTEQAVRDIRVCESEDFVNWSEPQRLIYNDVEDSPLYTNNVMVYPRAPHMFVGFPTRYYCRPGWSPNYDELCGHEVRKYRYNAEAREGLVITDCLFMCSHDGLHFTRYDEAFLPPPPENPSSWVYGDCYMARGLIETPSDIDGADPEYSMLVPDNHGDLTDSTRLIRYTIRMDGFVSLHAGAKEERIVTKPFIFEGSELFVNFATSARGYLYITLIGEDGTRMESCETFGNSIHRCIRFGGDVSTLSGKPVTMEVRMLDADIYAMKFE